MELETAFDIIKEQAKYLGYSEDSFETNNGNLVAEISSNANSKDLDPNKKFVTKIAGYGGEGLGSEYWHVFKIEHPKHGVGYIKYEGSYDSWEGVEWDYHTPRMVEPKEKTIIVYV